MSCASMVVSWYSGYICYLYPVLDVILHGADESIGVVAVVADVGVDGEDRDFLHLFHFYKIYGAEILF